MTDKNIDITSELIITYLIIWKLPDFHDNRFNKLYDYKFRFFAIISSQSLVSKISKV